LILSRNSPSKVKLLDFFRKKSYIHNMKITQREVFSPVEI
jgi:hypothetical protein